MGRRFKSLFLIGIGFVGGIIYLVSCGADAAPTADAKITYVKATGQTASCPAGSFIIGGGCHGTGCTNGERLQLSMPFDVTTWRCEMGCDTGTQVVHTQAICASATAGLTTEGTPGP